MVALAFVLIALIATAGCTTTARARDNAAAPQASERTVRVRAEDFGGEVRVQVGDVLRVEPPGDYDEWDMAYSSDVLRSLNTEEGRRRPPDAGWTFAVVARGSTDLSVSPVPARGGTPNVPKFVLTVTAR